MINQKGIVMEKRRCLEVFGDLVEAKLTANDTKKADWHEASGSGVSISDLLADLRVEVNELEEALIDQSKEEAMLEAADVAAFAMMIVCRLAGCQADRFGRIADHRH